MEEMLHSGLHWNLINFSIFVGLLFFFLRKPVKEFWEGRAVRIGFEIQEGEKLGRDAKARHDDLQKRVSRLDSDAQNLVLALEREGDLEKKQLQEDGNRRVARLRDDTARILDQEARKARETLKEQVAALALETAEKLIRENIRGEDQKRLSDGYLIGLERRVP
jgi:F-type H+-transporting ATPase subunit b